MTEYLQSRPLLRISILMIAGIAVGGMADTPSAFVDGALLFKVSGIAVVLLAFAIVLLRRHELLTSVLTTLMAFLFGVFLITNSKTQSTTTLYSSHASHNSTIQQSSTIAEWMDYQREKLSKTYRQQGITGDEYAVVAAMTLGEKQRVSRELKEVYSKSGAAHVFALSGLHMGILFMLLRFILPTKRFPKVCIVVELIALWMFVMLVGMHASVVRAAVMLSIYSVCRMLSRHTDNVSVLVLTATLLLLVCPQWLFDIGFQMSFLAVLSIVVLAVLLIQQLPMLEYGDALPRRLCRFALQYVYGVVIVSMVAQLGVAPLIAHYFGRASTYFLLTNIVVSPLAFFIIALALLLFIVLSAATLLGMPAALSYIIKGVAWLLSTVTSYLNEYLSWIASLPYASIEGIRLNTPQTFLVYLLICSILLLLHLLTRKRSMFDMKNYS